MATSRLTHAVILLAAACLLAFIATAPAFAAPISASKARAERIRRQVAVLDVRFDKIVELYDQANFKLAAVRKQISGNTKQLQLARFNLDVANRNLAARAVALYEQRPVDLLDVFFVSSSFDALTTQLALMAKVGRNDSDIVASVTQYKQAVSERRSSLMADRADASKLLAQVADKKHAITQTLAQRRHMLHGVEAQIRRMEAAEQARLRRIVDAKKRSGGQTPIIPASGGPGHPEVCAIAARYLGIPYLYGGSSPSTGFDCSGFVMYVYAQIGISLPHYSGAQQQMGTRVSMSDLLPGDLVFRGYPAYHVGIYVGSGTVIHSPHTGAVVSYESVSGWDNAVRL